MPEQDRQNQISSEATPFLQSRPVPRARRGPALLLLLLGGILIVGVGAVVAWHAFSTSNVPASVSATGTVVPASKNSSQSGSMPPGWNDPALYWQTIRDQVAQNLHLSTSQITTKLLAAGAATIGTPASSSNQKRTTIDPGAPMAALAVDQGISSSQLRTIELNALQSACDVMVTQGKLTRVEANQRLQILDAVDQGTLNWYVTRAFIG